MQSSEFSDRLFLVMRDEISCEEVFEADVAAIQLEEQAEFNAVCDEWQNEAILTQDAEKESEKKVKKVLDYTR